MAVATEVSTTGLVDTKRRSDRRKRRQWSAAVKRQIVTETLEPGSSVSIVARRHDVNANQVFKWRREIAPEASAPEPEPRVEQSVPLLPVEIVSEPSGEPRPRARRGGTIEITFGCGARVRLRGEVSPETLRQVIELLR
jgi:transposase